MKSSGIVFMSILLRWKGAAVTGAPLFERTVCGVLPTTTATLDGSHSLLAAKYNDRQHTP